MKERKTGERGGRKGKKKRKTGAVNVSSAKHYAEETALPGQSEKTKGRARLALCSTRVRGSARKRLTSSSRPRRSSDGYIAVLAFLLAPL